MLDALELMNKQCFPYVYEKHYRSSHVNAPVAVIAFHINFQEKYVEALASYIVHMGNSIFKLCDFS